uniref:Uncharacterized protein n=1 Tax=Anopheles funestus TaxID=62324 RepID=A0A182S139_ANOFN
MPMYGVLGTKPAGFTVPSSCNRCSISCFSVLPCSNPFCFVCSLSSSRPQYPKTEDRQREEPCVRVCVLVLFPFGFAARATPRHRPSHGRNNNNKKRERESRGGTVRTAN